MAENVTHSSVSPYRSLWGASCFHCNTYPMSIPKSTFPFIYIYPRTQPLGKNLNQDKL